MADLNVKLKNKAGEQLYVQTKGSLVLNNSGENLGTVEAGAQVNKIEKITVNGVELTITNKTAAITTVDAYSKTESDGKYATKDEVSAIPKYKTQVVEELPQTGENATIYLVKSGAGSKNLYTEYIYVDGDFEELGSQKVDISGKQDKLSEAQLAAVNSGITEAKVTKYDGYEAAIAGKQSTIDDLETIRANATAGKGAADTIANYGDIVSHNASEFAKAGDAYTKTEIENKIEGFITYEVLA